jgi:hypothetical protein
MRMERTWVKIVNNVTDKPKDAEFKGGLRANGEFPFENRVRKRSKMKLCRVREGVMEDVSNPLANLPQDFVTEAEKTHDVHVVPHGQEPPTQKFSRKMDAESDAHVASGLIKGGDFCLDVF